MPLFALVAFCSTRANKQKQVHQTKTSRKEGLIRSDVPGNLGLCCQANSLLSAAVCRIHMVLDNMAPKLLSPSTCLYATIRWLVISCPVSGYRQVGGCASQSLGADDANPSTNRPTTPQWPHLHRIQKVSSLCGETLRIGQTTSSCGAWSVSSSRRFGFTRGSTFSSSICCIIHSLASCELRASCGTARGDSNETREAEGYLFPQQLKALGPQPR